MNIKFKEFVSDYKYLIDSLGNRTRIYVDAAEQVTMWLKENSVKIIDWKVATINDGCIVIIIQYCELDKQDEVQFNE